MKKMPTRKDLAFLRNSDTMQSILSLARHFSENGGYNVRIWQDKNQKKARKQIEAAKTND